MSNNGPPTRGLPSSSASSGNSNSAAQQQRIDMIKQYYGQLTANLRTLTTQLQQPDLPRERRLHLQQQHERLSTQLQDFSDKVLRPLMTSGSLPSGQINHPASSSSLSDRAKRSNPQSPHKRPLASTARPAAPTSRPNTQQLQQRLLQLNQQAQSTQRRAFPTLTKLRQTCFEETPPTLWRDTTGFTAMVGGEEVEEEMELDGGNGEDESPYDLYDDEDDFYATEDGSVRGKRRPRKPTRKGLLARRGLSAHANRTNCLLYDHQADLQAYLQAYPVLERKDFAGMERQVRAVCRTATVLAEMRSETGANSSSPTIGNEYDEEEGRQVDATLHVVGVRDVGAALKWHRHAIERDLRFWTHALLRAVTIQGQSHSHQGNPHQSQSHQQQNWWDLGRRCVRKPTAAANPAHQQRLLMVRRFLARQHASSAAKPAIASEEDAAAAGEQEQEELAEPDEDDE